VSFDPAKDIQAPMTLAVAAENSTTKGAWLFLATRILRATRPTSAGLGDILINSIDWAAEQENLISLTPKNSVTRTFQPPPRLSWSASSCSRSASSRCW